jgi:hypothetical protein
MSTLGENGRLGNQIFQYFFLKLVQAELGFEIRTNPWLGNMMFSLSSTQNILECKNFLQFGASFTESDSPQSHLDSIGEIVLPNHENLIDIVGFFQYHSKHLLKYQILFSQTFSINTCILEQVEKKLNTMKMNGQSLIAIHFRAGDYLQHEALGDPIFVSPSIDEINKIIKSIGGQEKRMAPLIYLASDDLDHASSLLSSKNIPHITSYDLLTNPSDEDSLLLDFILFTLADILLISNSSLSFAGAMLNKKAKNFFRPRMEDKKYVEFDPWNDFVLRKKTSSP